MRQFLIVTTALALSLPTFASATGGRDFLTGSRPFQFMPEARSNPGITAGVKSDRAARTAPRALAATLPAGDMTGYLDAPDMTTWFYTMDYDKETIDHGSWKEENIKGFTVTVYDSAFKEIGKISDTVTLGEGETRVAQIEVGSQVTRKFFNYDNNYELMVAFSVNTADYTNNTYTRVYSLGGPSESIMTLPGYYVSAVNTASDSWSEKFWLTFLTEEASETSEIGGVINTADYVFTVYKAAGYSGMGDPVLSVRVPVITTAGENAVPFLASVGPDNLPYFAVNRMKYCWFRNPFDFNDETPTPDNELIVDIYSLPSAWASTVEKYSTTRIPSDATVDNRTFFYVGAFSYMDDLSFGRYTADGTPSLIVTKETHISASDSYYYDYDVYSTAAKDGDAAGEVKMSLASKVAGGYFMSDIAGFDPQVMFLRPTEEGSFDFDFVSLISGKVEQTLPAVLDGGVAVSVSTDRVPGGGSYLYATASTRGYSDSEGNVWTDVSYITRDARVDHVDHLNLGQNIDMAQVYISGDAFDPYTFNLDDNREYMVLVKRRDPAQNNNREELLVVSSDPDKGTLLSVEPDDNLGALASVFFANLGSEAPRLIVIFGKDYRYTTVSYDLPLTLFEQGTGTPDDPYHITTAGGLLQLRAKPDAYYVIDNDIDAAGVRYSPLNFTFTGNIDGRGHVISNLSLGGRSLVPSLSNPDAFEGGELSLTGKGVIRNLSFVNPVFEPTADVQGFVAGELSAGLVSGVHLYGASVVSEGSVAGLVGQAVLNSRIEGCSVEGSVTAREGSAGGIVVSTRTGATVKACAFTGTLTGESEVGGIAGSLGTNSGTVENCHVSAEIKAANTVGGIAGSDDSRAAVRFCHVEGSIEATEAPRWGGGPKAGGILGSLQTGFSGGEVEENPSAGGPVVEGCFVNLKSLKYTGEQLGAGEYPSQNSTIHRIVGRSAVNDEPEVIDYDSDYNPVYGDPAAPDDGLKNNYAIATLEVIDAAVGAGKDSTEGASLTAAEAGRDFFTSLGYKYGNDVDEPWSYTGEPSAPSLFFETGLLTVTPTTAVIEQDSEVTFEVTIHGKSYASAEDLMGDLMCDISDESVIETTDMAFDGNVLSLTVKGLAPGTAAVKVSVGQASVSAEVTVTRKASIDNIAPDGAGQTVSFDGRVVTAAGSRISVYTVAGAKVAEGRDSLDLSHLAKGVYVVGTSAAGSIKVAIR